MADNVPMLTRERAFDCIEQNKHDVKHGNAYQLDDDTVAALEALASGRAVCVPVGQEPVAQEFRWFLAGTREPNTPWMRREGDEASFDLIRRNPDLGETRNLYLHPSVPVGGEAVRWEWRLVMANGFAGPWHACEKDWHDRCLVAPIALPEGCRHEVRALYTSPPVQPQTSLLTPEVIERYAQPQSEGVSAEVHRLRVMASRAVGFLEVQPNERANAIAKELQQAIEAAALSTTKKGGER